MGWIGQVIKTGKVSAQVPAARTGGRAVGEDPLTAGWLERGHAGPGTWHLPYGAGVGQTVGPPHHLVMRLALRKVALGFFVKWPPALPLQAASCPPDEHFPCAYAAFLPVIPTTAQLPYL